jgi:site-specific DNA-methyltransferase (adenine-specific)
MKNIPDKSIDLILCDLPYGKKVGKWDVVIPFDLLWKEYKRIVKDRRAILLFGIEPFSSIMRISNMDEFKYDWIWQKTRPSGFAHAKNMPLKDFELISVFSNGSINHASVSKKRMVYFPQGLSNLEKPKLMKNDPYRAISASFSARKSHHEYIRKIGNYPRTVIKFGSEGKPIHPTQKPVDLLEYLIKTYTVEGETVLDNTMGSGSTGVACVRTKRNFIGMEKEEKYFTIAKERIEKESTS